MHNGWSISVRLDNKENNLFADFSLWDEGDMGEVTWDDLEWRLLVALLVVIRLVLPEDVVVDGIFWTTLSWRNTKDSFGALINERWGCLDIALGDKGASDGEATPFCNFDARFQVFLTLAGAGTARDRRG